MDRGIFATAVGGGGAPHVSGGWGSGGAGRNPSVDSGAGYRSGARVQQYKVEFDVDRHYAGFGASFSELMVAEGAAGCGGDSVIGGEERTSYFYDRRAGDSRGSWFSQWQASSQRRSCLLGDFGFGGGDAALDSAAARVAPSG